MKENTQKKTPGGNRALSEKQTSTLYANNNMAPNNSATIPATLIKALKPIISRVNTSVCAKVVNGQASWTGQPLTSAKMLEHVSAGSGVRYGAAPIKPGTSVTQIGLLDFDSHKGETRWSEMQDAALKVISALEDRGAKPIAFRSSGGKGIHVYLLWDDPQDAYSVRMFLKSALESTGFKSGTKGVAAGEVEVFPKQNSVGEGAHGNMFVLPLAGQSVPLEILCGLEPMPREYAAAMAWAVSNPVPVVTREVPTRLINNVVSADFGTLVSALDAIPNEGESELSYDDWRNVVFGIHNATAGSDDGLALAHRFSARSSKYDPDFLESRVWPYVKDAHDSERGEITARTIYSMARKFGNWIEPVIDDFEVLPPPSAEELAEAQAIQERNHVPTFSEISKDISDFADSEKPPGGVPAIIKKLAKSSAAPSQVDALLKDLKRVSGTSMGALREELAFARKDLSGDGGETHHTFAKKLLKAYTAGEYEPVSAEGRLFVVDRELNIWVAIDEGVLASEVATRFDGADKCSRNSDYKAIAQHAITLASDAKFFDGAPVGLACGSDFIRLKSNGDAVIEQLTPGHRQKVRLDFRPEPGPMPLFNKFLAETFASTNQEETAAQTNLLQEIMGATTFGFMASYEKAVLLLDRYGRGGKGTTARIQEALVPAGFRCACSPFTWDREYYLANMASMRLNVVGELPEEQVIPAAYVKSVLGRDTQSGRQPTGRVFNFTNTAAHWFMSNHFIQTRDHSEAFFARWLILEFPNSRLRSGAPIDKDLAAKIIANEMPQILAWAMEGAQRLLRRGDAGFTETPNHKRLMDAWKGGTNTVMAFVRDEEFCILGSGKDGKPLEFNRASFYGNYVEWCARSGRKPMNKSKVFNLVEDGLGFGLTIARTATGSVVRGVGDAKILDFDAAAGESD